MRRAYQQQTSSIFASPYSLTNFTRVNAANNEIWQLHYLSKVSSVKTISLQLLNGTADKTAELSFRSQV
ncbi:hypothetical protein EMIT0P265_180024 [Pseudomonas zeae]